MPARNKVYSGVKVNILNLQKRIPINRSISSDIKKAVRETIISERQINGSTALTIDTEPRQRRGECLKSAQINICLCDDKKIRDFNKKYFSKDCPTDVIAFNLRAPDNRNSLAADIIISADTAVSNSKIFKTAPLYELFLYVIHGMLHILGGDDNTEKKRINMNKKQERICRKIFNTNLH